MVAEQQRTGRPYGRGSDQWPWMLALWTLVASALAATGYFIRRLYHLRTEVDEEEEEDVAATSRVPKCDDFFRDFKALEASLVPADMKKLDKICRRRLRKLVNLSDSDPQEALRLVQLSIRTTFVQHTADHVGRRMALRAVKMAKSVILDGVAAEDDGAIKGETENSEGKRKNQEAVFKRWLTKIYKNNNPRTTQRLNLAKMILFGPVLAIALFGADIYSDIQVNQQLYHLQKDIDINRIFNKSDSSFPDLVGDIVHFAIQMAIEPGPYILADPCRTLRDLDFTLERGIPFYKSFVKKALGIDYDALETGTDELDRSLSHGHKLFGTVHLVYKEIISALGTNTLKISPLLNISKNFEDSMESILSKVEKVGSFRPLLERINEDLGAFDVSTLSGYKSKLEIARSLLSSFGKEFVSIASKARNVLNSVEAKAEGFVDKITDRTEGVLAEVKGEALEVVRKAEGGVTDAMDFIADTKPRVASLLARSENAVGEVEQIIDKVNGKVEAFSGVSGIVNGISGALNSLNEEAKPAPTFNPVSKVQSIGHKAQNLGKTLGGVFEGFGRRKRSSAPPSLDLSVLLDRFEPEIEALIGGMGKIQALLEQYRDFDLGNTAPDMLDALDKEIRKVEHFKDPIHQLNSVLFKWKTYEYLTSQEADNSSVIVTADTVLQYGCPAMSKFFEFMLSHRQTTFVEIMHNETYAAKFGNNSASLRCAAVLKMVPLALKEREGTMALSSRTTYKTMEAFFSNPELMGVQTIMQGSLTQLTFAIRHLILAAFAYLSFVCCRTLFCQLVRFAKDYYKHRKRPFVLKWSLMKTLVSGTEFKELNRPQDLYALATRYSVSIHEAVDETLNAVKLQVALFFTVRVFMERLNRTLRLGVTGYFLTTTDIGFPDSDIFTFSWSSPIMVSTLMGLFSLTMAQFNLNQTKHQFDTDFKAKAIYFFTCLANSLSIFVTEITYFCFTFPFFYLLMLVMLQVSRGTMFEKDQGPGIQDTDLLFVFVLIFVMVIFPVVWIPRKVAFLLRQWLEQVLVRKSQSLRDQKRGGYRFFNQTLHYCLFFPAAELKELEENEEGNVCPEYYAFQRGARSRKLYR